MNYLIYLPVILLLHRADPVYSQDTAARIINNSFIVSKLTLEPGIGVKPYPNADILVSMVVQWNVKKRLSLVSYSAYAYNNAFLREVYYITNDYNYSLTQKFGAGSSLYTRHSSHTLSLMAGIKYDAFKETLNNPDFEKASMSVSSVSPDFGLLYNLKIGNKKYYFIYRMYIPLYPYPFLTFDFNAFDGNMANMTLEAGAGIRIK
jgi:hypothetical protein